VSARPFRVLGVQQIAVGHLDKQRLRRLWVDLLGVEIQRAYRSESENVDEDIALLGRGLTAVELDLMQPLDAARSPRVHEPALNHVGLWVDDLDQAVAWLSAAGVRFAGGVRVGAQSHRVAFIHPKSSNEAPQGGEGVLIELVEAPAAVRAAFDAVANVGGAPALSE